MADSDALYEVQDWTGNAAHASVDDVCDLLLSRAAAPRHDHEDAHFDAAMAAILDTGRRDSTERQIIAVVP